MQRLLETECVQYFGSIGNKALTEVIDPLREIGMDYSEYCLVKAMCFFGNGIILLDMLQTYFFRCGIIDRRQGGGECST